MLPFCSIKNDYLDKFRKIDYYRIVKILEYENKANPNRAPKGIIGTKYNYFDSW